MNIVNNKESWDKSWTNGIAFRSYHGIERFMVGNRKLYSLLGKYLEKNSQKVVFEIGCAMGKYLIYFNRKFGYRVSGIDISSKGLEITRRNLRKANLPITDIWEEDLFKFKNERLFDVVCSFGLVEHFENWEELLDIHLRLLKDNGTLVITMPNVNKDSVYFKDALRAGDKQFLNMFNIGIIDEEVMKRYAVSRNLDIKYIGYVGMFDIFVFCRGRLLKLSKALLMLIHMVNQMIGYGGYWIPSSKYYSPCFIMVATKK